MMSKLALAMLLSQYARSRATDDVDATCLYWLETSVIEYRQSVLGNPETPGENEFTAINRSFSTWQEQLLTCGSVSFKEGPRTASRSVGYAVDGGNENLVIFRQKACTLVAPATDACWAAGACGNAFDCWEHSAAAIAITTTSFHPTAGRVYDSDVELNKPGYVFSTVDAPVCTGGRYSTACVATDLQNTLTHEAGHVLGLAHVGVTGSTMNARADPGELSKRVLDQGSKDFVCDVYPRGAPSVSCVLPPLTETLGARSARGCATAPGEPSAWVWALALVAGRFLSRET
jgi:hypothetical protein